MADRHLARESIDTDPWCSRAAVLLLVLTLAFALPVGDALAQSQGYKTGYGRLQRPAQNPGTTEAPRSGLSLGTGTLVATGALAAAIGIGLAVAGTGGDDDSGDGGAGSTPNIVGTSTK